MPVSSKTPVTIVTGFLGSGKTLVNNYRYFYSKSPSENEFGQVSIDEELVSETSKKKKIL